MKIHILTKIFCIFTLCGISHSLCENLGVVGLGYVGLITGICFSELGNNIFGVEVDPIKIDLLKRGKSHIYEPGLDKLLTTNRERINFFTSIKDILDKSEIIVLALPTPMSDKGDCNLSYIFGTIDEIAKNIKLDKELILVVKSTVLPGTCRKIDTFFKEKGFDKISVVSMPEFLREGCAIYDFFNPDRIIVGLENSSDIKLQDRFNKLFKFFIDKNIPILYTAWENSELIKYASNTFLANKITFINQLSQICEAIKADVDVVALGMGLDKRIGKDFLNAGPGFGGSCFPKDVMALINFSQTLDRSFGLAEETFYYNKKHIKACANKILKLLDFEPGESKTVTIWGVAFKENTDDLRFAPALKIAQILGASGVQVKGYDSNLKKSPQGIALVDDIYESCKDSDLLVILNGDVKFNDLDMNLVGANMRTKMIYDTRRIFKNKMLDGFKYFALGIG